MAISTTRYNTNIDAGHQKRPFLLSIATFVAAIIVFFSFSLALSSNVVLVYIPVVLAIGALVLNIIAIKKTNAFAKLLLVITIPLLLISLFLSFVYGSLFSTVAPGQYSNTDGKYSLTIPSNLQGRVTAGKGILLLYPQQSSLPNGAEPSSQNNTAQNYGSVPVLTIIPLGETNKVQSSNFAKQVNTGLAQKFLQQQPGGKILYNSTTTPNNLILYAQSFVEPGTGRTAISGDVDSIPHKQSYLFAMSIPANTDTAIVNSFWATLNSLRYSP